VFELNYKVYAARHHGIYRAWREDNAFDRGIYRPLHIRALKNHAPPNPSWDEHRLFVSKVVARAGGEDPLSVYLGLTGPHFALLYLVVRVFEAVERP